MMFTSGLAADILFYSLCEWILTLRILMAEMGSIQQWSGHTRYSTGQPLELLSDSGRILRIYAPCAAAINRNFPRPAALCWAAGPIRLRENH